MAKILAVDDEPAILEMIESILNKDGHLVTKVSNPLKINMEELHRYDLILLDIMMPGIDVPGTTIHVFYATKMGRKYEKRYCTYFKNPDIRRHNMQHEELFCCHSAEWVEEVRKAVEGDR